MTKMYLEVSGRRTGKTTRLIEAFRNAGGERRLIVVPTRRMKSFYPTDVREWTVCVEDLMKMGSSRGSRGSYKQTWNGGFAQGIDYGGLPASDYRLYWDEFAMLDEEIMRGSMDLLRDKDYFATTPRRFYSSEDYLAWIEGKPSIFLDVLALYGKKPEKYAWGEAPWMEDYKVWGDTLRKYTDVDAMYELTFEMAVELKREKNK